MTTSVMLNTNPKLTAIRETAQLAKSFTPTLDSKITFLYSQGSTTRDIVETLEKLWCGDIANTGVTGDRDGSSRYA